MLRPSKFQLSSTDGESGSNSLLKPSRFASTAAAFSEDSNSGSSNPFLSVANTSIDEDSSSAAASKRDEGRSDENADPLSKLTRHSQLPKSNLFSGKSSISETPGFVFGQNISDRVVGTAEKGDDGDVGEAQRSEPESGGGLLFSAGLAKSASAEALEKKEVDGQSLLEATKIYEQSKFDPVFLSSLY